MNKLGIFKNARGYVLSPFFLVGLIILGSLLAMHIINTDAKRAEAIQAEGTITKGSMELESLKSFYQSKALFAGYTAIDYSMDLNRQTGVYDSNYLRQRLPTSDYASLKDYMEKVIKIELGALNVQIIVDDKIIDKGFLVKGEISSPNVNRETKEIEKISIEKLVDARIFLLQKLSDGMDASIGDELANEMTRHLSGVDCQYLKQDGSISCKTKKPDFLPADYMRNEASIKERIKESIIQVERNTITGKVMSQNTNLKKMKDDEVGFTLSAKEVTAGIKVLKDGRHQGSQKCTYTKSAPNKDPEVYEECHYESYDPDYNPSLEITGEVTYDYSLVDHATVTEKERSKFEVCTRAPMIFSDGTIKPLEFLKTDRKVKYKILLEYESDCKPVIFADRSISIGNLGLKKVPDYTDNKESLRFDDNVIRCPTPVSEKAELDNGKAGSESCLKCDKNDLFWDEKNPVCTLKKVSTGGKGTYNTEGYSNNDPNNPRNAECRRKLRNPVCVDGSNQPTSLPCMGMFMGANGKCQCSSCGTAADMTCRQKFQNPVCVDKNNKATNLACIDIFMSTRGVCSCSSCI